MLTYNTVDNLSDEQLVEKAQAGDSYAMESIILRYRNTVNAVASKYYAVGFDREDIVQEGMIGLYNAVLDYNPEKNHFKSFAGLCITRRIISLIKLSARQKHIPLNSSVSLNSVVSEESDTYLADVLTASDSTDPETLVISKEACYGYTKKIQGLLSPFELKVLACCIDGLSYKDISERLKRDVKAVDNAIQRIRKKLEAVFDFEP